MTTHNYTYAELATAGTHPHNLYQKCLDHGYTNPVVIDLSDGTVDVTIDEADDKPTVLSNLEAATIPTLSIDKTSLVITGDGVATDTLQVTDSRGAGASGKTVKLMLPGAYIKVDADSATLDGSGQALFTFGPLSGCTGTLHLSVYYNNGEANSQPFTLRFGS